MEGSLRDMEGSRVVKNASWIIVCRVIQSVLSFIISMMTARYLGPSNFGVINYAASLVAFVTPIMKLGLDSVLVKEFVDSPDKEGEIIGTALLMNVASSVLCMGGVVAFCAIVNGDETVTLIVCALYSLVLMAQSLEMIIYWFQAKLLSKYSSIVSLIAYVVVSMYKIFLLVTEKSVYWFAVSNTLDFLLIGIILHLLFRKLSNKKLSFSFVRAKKMFGYSKYYILSGLMVTVFSQTDRVMLKLMVDDAAVGYYSAAVSCAGITSFVFSAVIESMRPIILEWKNKNYLMYELYIIRLYTIIIYGSLIQSVFVTVFARQIVNLIYGISYMPAVPGLQIIVWFTTFSYYGGAKDIWILAEGKQKYLVTLNFAGALVNVALNFCMIPIWGISGAALASLITQFFANIVMGVLIKELRRNNILMLRALNPRCLKEMLTALKSMKLRDKNRRD